MKLTLDSGKHQREKTIADHAIGSEYFTEKIIMLNHQWDMTKLNFFRGENIRRGSQTVKLLFPTSNSKLLRLSPFHPKLNSGIISLLQVAEWIKLNDSYFPTFFSGSRCTRQGLSCSFPTGQTCEPDVG